MTGDPEGGPGPDMEPGDALTWHRMGLAGRRASLVRLGVALFAAVAYGIWGAPVPHNPALAWAGVAGAIVYSLLLLVLDPYERFDFLTSAWTISTTDAFLITLFLVATGGWNSPWFPLWYLSVFALSLRFGTAETLTAATGYMVIYGGIAALGGALPAEIGVFVVRMGFLYAIAALGVLLSQALLEETVERREYEALARGRKYEVSLLESILDSTEEGILVVGPDGEIVEWNDRFQVMWGLPDDVLEEGNDEAALDHVLDQLEDPDAFLGRVRELYDHPRETSFDVLRFRDGRVFERFSRPQTLDAEVVGRVWSFRDITDRKAAEEALEDQARRLRRKNDELEQFAYVVSHDLKTPLQGIRHLVDWLEEDLEDVPEDVDEHLRRLDDRATRMHDMIEDLLEMARLSRDEADPEEEVDVEAVLDEVKEVVDPPEGFTVEAQGDLPTVRAPRARFRQVLQNLVDNAVKHHDGEEGTVTVDAGRWDGEVLVSVADDGPGIPAGFQSKVFEPFQSLDPPEEAEGTGAGMAIVRRIVEGRGGGIEIESEEGRGTTVRFTWPEDPGSA